MTIISSLDVLAIDNHRANADLGISYGASTGKSMGNLTSGVTTPFAGRTAVGANN